ncbi:MAG: sulfite oxidase [Candidatus Sericytochromatia bacterium]|nr:sulfite oxidase [Candidatus Sericytochromatia bacterium]
MTGTRAGMDRRAFLGTLAGACGLAAAGPGLLGLLTTCAQAAEARSPGRVVKEGLLVRSSRPLDLETPVALLDADLTPTRHFFVRTHHDEPVLDTAAWRLQVEGLVERPAALSLAELRALPRHEVTAVLQCSGNGRAFYRPRVPGVPWERGAVGNARWAGARLRDVLERAGLKAGAAHVVLQGADQPVLPTTPRFGRSVPLAKALHPDTLLAYEMNGEPLPVLHGHPVRVVVPGWVGDDWVKWVGLVRVQAEPFEGFFYRTAYRYPTRPVTPGEAVAPEAMAPMDELLVKGLITAPLAGARLPRAPVPIRGAAWTGGEAIVTGVEVSVDDGLSWLPARLLGEARPYAWRRFALDWTPPAGHPGGLLRLRARATDSQGRTQPVEASPWNPSGYQWNTADVVEVHLHA